MKRLLALLLLFCSPAFAQQIDWSGAINVENTVINPTMNDCAAGLNSPACGAWKESTGFAPGDWSGGSYTFSYFENKLYQDIDLSQYNTNLFNFIFSFDLNNSCRNSIGGYCENVNGPIDFISAKIYFYDENGLNNQFTFLNGNVSTARIECSSFDIFGLCLGGYSAYDQWQSFGWYSHVQSDSLFTSARIEFSGYDVGYWGGLYGPSIDNASLQINYYPDFPYWNRLSSEYQQFTLTEDSVVRYGANGVYTYKTLQAGTYECGNGLFGDPIGGVVKSCEIGTNDLPVVAVDCEIYPFDTSCIINSTIDDITEQPMFAEEDYTGSDDEEEEDFSAAEEEMFFAAEELFDNPYEEEMDESLEELLADESFASEEDEDLIEVVASLSPIKEMADEEKAVTLSDSISKDVLESALSIAAAAETSGASGGSPSESSSSSSSSRSSGMTSGGGSEMSVASAESNFSGGSFDGSGQEQFAAGDASMELLETGRVMGQDALASTMAATEASAIDSMSQAESIAQTSSLDSMGTSSTAETIDSIEIENVIETVASIVESSTDTSMEMMGMMPENTGDTGVVTDGSDMFGFIENNPAAASVQEAEEIALAVVNNAIASGEQKTFEDEYNPDAEVTNSMVDPALAMANTFNQPPSMMNLEILGIIKPIEEKSDAERSAERVIAANKEQQEEINKNYMDADQSGIVAAIAVDADVSAYLSARLMDNNAWYKPEDIYKGVIIRDNVRGSYFLEKGNTDTYKKMVEEQYKDE